MLKLQSVISPHLDGSGDFTVTFGEFKGIVNDGAGLPITGPTVIGGNTVLMSNTTGFRVGQTITIRDNIGHSESQVIAVVTPNTSIQIVGVWAVVYTVAHGGCITVTCPRVAVSLANPFTANTDLATQWSVAGNIVTVTVYTLKPTLPADTWPLLWAIAADGDVVGVVFSVLVDGE